MTSLVACSNQSALEVGPGEAETDDGKADGSGGKTELKVTVAAADIAKARSRLTLRNDKSQTRRIWFYDTQSLLLFHTGTIMRAREIDGDEDDSTVKLRPFTLAQLAKEFRTLEDIKCENDTDPDSTTASCSLKDDRDEGEIAAVGRGEKPLTELFDSEQEDLYAAYGNGPDLVDLVPFGPINARVWTIRTDALPEKVTAELWYMPDETQTLELSLKVEDKDADETMDKLVDFIEDKGLRLDPNQDSKTRRALEAFAAAAAP